MSNSKDNFPFDPKMDIKNLIQEGLRLFENKSLTAAIEQWKEVLLADPFNKEALFYIKEAFKEIDRLKLIAKLLGSSSIALQKGDFINAVVDALIAAGLDKENIPAIEAVNKIIASRLAPPQSPSSEEISVVEFAEHSPEEVSDSFNDELEELGLDTEITRETNMSQALLDEATNLYKQGKLISALRVFQCILTIEPKHSIAPDMISIIEERLISEYKPKVGNGDVILSKKETKSYQLEQYELTLDEKFVYSLIDGKKSLNQLIAQTSLSPGVFYKNIHTLIEKELIEKIDNKGGN